MNISIGLSTDKNPLSAAIEATKLASVNMYGERADLAFVFSSIDISSARLLKTINTSLEERLPIIGCSGAAIISNQGVFKHGLAVMLLGLPEGTHFNLACAKNIKTKTTLNAGRELADGLLYNFKDTHRVLSVIFCDGLIPDGSGLIYGLQERLGRSFPVVGGSASDDLRFLKTHLYFNEELIEDAALGILFGGRLNFGLGIKHGLKPLGKPRTVTRAEGNIVYEIDGKPALNLYEEYLNRNAFELRKELKRISVLYPIGIYLSGEEEYLLRNILSIESNGSLRLQGGISEGSTIRLMIGTKESALAATRQAAGEAKKGLSLQGMGTKKEKIKNFALVFNSVSRYILLRRDVLKELEIIKDVLGEDTPIIGIYTYGEQAPLRAVSYQGQTYFHNQTIAILTIGG